MTNKNILKHLSVVVLLFMSYFLVHFSILALTTEATEGDSVKYHIPLAGSVLNGKILNPTWVTGYEVDSVLHFYPAIGEVILSFFVLLNVPLNFYNVLALIFLFIACFFLGKRLNFTTSYSIIFAGSVTALQTITRWMNSQIIDIWLAVFFVASLAHILKPQDSRRWYLILGVTVGLLTGVKYSGIFISFMLLAVFFREFIKYMNVTRFIIFLIPFSVLGLSWYARNFIVIGNPFYPQPFLIFPGAEWWNIFKFQIWEMILLFPGKMLNAYISEYMLWSMVLVAVPLMLMFKLLVLKTRVQPIVWKVFILSVIDLLFYVQLVSDLNYDIMVSSFRYSYPVFIGFIVLAFYLAKELKLEKYVAFFVILNLIGFQQFPYQPKILFVTAVLVLIGLLIFRKLNIRYE